MAGAVICSVSGSRGHSDDGAGHIGFSRQGVGTTAVEADTYRLPIAVHAGLEGCEPL